MGDLEKLSIEELEVECRRLEGRYLEKEFDLKRKIEEENEYEKGIYSELVKIREMEIECYKHPEIVKLLNKQEKVLIDLKKSYSDLFDEIEEERKKERKMFDDLTNTIQSEVKKRKG